MKAIEILQQVERMSEVRNHVKSQLNYHSIKNGEVQKVHFQNLLPTLNRLLAIDMYKDIAALFDSNASETIAQQLLNLLGNIGEIAKVPGGHYLPLPERGVKLPVSKKVIILSSTKKYETNMPYSGLASGYGKSDFVPQLTINEWFPSIDSKEFIAIINNSLPYEINEEPSHVFFAKEKREWNSYEKVENKNKIIFIARFNMAQGPSLYYWVKKRNNKASYFHIPISYLDIAKFAIEYQEGINRKVEFTSLNEKFIKVKFRHRIPNAEQNMLMLFAFPDSFYDPFNWFVPRIHLEDVVFITKRLGMNIQHL